MVLFADVERFCGQVGSFFYPTNGPRDTCVPDSWCMENLVKSTNGGGGGAVRLAGGGASADGGKPDGGTQVEVVYVTKVRILGRDVMSSEQHTTRRTHRSHPKKCVMTAEAVSLSLHSQSCPWGLGASEEMSTAQHLSVASSRVATTFADSTGLVSNFAPCRPWSYPREANTLMPNAPACYSYLPPLAKQWPCGSNLTKGLPAWLRKTAQRT